MASGPLGAPRPGADSILVFEILSEVRQSDDPLTPEELGVPPDAIERVRNLSISGKLRNLSSVQEIIPFTDRGRLKSDLDIDNQQITSEIIFGRGDESGVATISEVTEKFLFLKDQLDAAGLEHQIRNLEITADTVGRFGGPRPMAQSNLRTTHTITTQQLLSPDQRNELRGKVDASQDIDIVTLESTRTSQMPGLVLDKDIISIRVGKSIQGPDLNIIVNYNVTSINWTVIRTINNIIRDVVNDPQIIEISFESF